MTTGASGLRALRNTGWYLVLVLPFAMFTGCSNGQLPTYPVSGRVIFPDGSPVHMGSIEFKSLEHPIQARGTIANDGSFRLSTYGENDGAVAGNHRCVVTQFVIVEDIPNFKPSHEGVVHPRFGSYQTSGLEFDVSDSEENFITVTVQGLAEADRDKSEEKKSPHKHEHDTSIK
jgi:hypothetical protein